MKILMTATLLLIIASNTQISSCQKKVAATGLLPLQKGNEWIYRDSMFKDDQLAAVEYDTLRIEGTSTFGKETSYLFSDGKEMLVHGDTLFQLVRQRSGVKFPTPVFIATPSSTQFNYAYGGDVVKQRTVEKMASCPANAFNITQCYHAYDAGNCEEMYFGYGIGFLREKQKQCWSEENIVVSKTLVSMKVK